MKSLIKSAVALSLLTFASAPFAQDDVEEEGGFFSGIANFFGGIFSSDDEEPARGGEGGWEWYLGGQYGVTKYEDDKIRVPQGFGYYGGLSLSNRLGAEVGFFDFGDAEIKNGGGDEVATDGIRGMITAATEVGDAPVRLGLGYYSLDTAIAGVSESSSGVSVGVRFEQGLTRNFYLTLGTDLFFQVGAEGAKNDVALFTVGLSFHTDPPLPALDGDDGDGGVEVTPVDDSYGDYGDYGSYDYGGGGDDAGAADDAGSGGDDFGDYDYSGDDAGGDGADDAGGGGVEGEPAPDDYGDYDYDDAMPE